MRCREPKLERDFSLADAFRRDGRSANSATNAAFAADVERSSLGGLRDQPPERSLRRRRTHGRFGEQLAGSRRLCRLREGTYRYDPAPHRLVPVAAGDLRRFALGARQGAGGANAPVRLIYVADIGKLEHTSGFDEPGLHDPEVQKSYYYVDTGLIAGNVYLFAASRGLAAWFHNCDRRGVLGEARPRRHSAGRCLARRSDIQSGRTDGEYASHSRR